MEQNPSDCIKILIKKRNKIRKNTSKNLIKILQKHKILTSLGILQGKIIFIYYKLKHLLHNWSGCFYSKMLPYFFRKTSLSWTHTSKEEKYFLTHLPMLHAKDRFLIEIFECWILDLQFFFWLLQKLEDHDLYLDTQKVLQEYGNFHLNVFISEVLYLLAEWFLKKYQHKISEMLNIWDFDRYREENELYETYTNLLDSHIWFHNEKIQNLFENSEFYYR